MRGRVLFSGRSADISFICIIFAVDKQKSAGCSTVGSALRSGRRGRKFESSHPDNTKITGIFARGCLLLYLLKNMADNFLENQYEQYLKQKASKEAAKRAAWRKRLQAYKEKLAQEKSASSGGNADSEISKSQL